jgi:hypothetical protein
VGLFAYGDQRSGETCDYSGGLASGFGGDDGQDVDPAHPLTLKNAAVAVTNSADSPFGPV